MNVAQTFSKHRREMRQFGRRFWLRNVFRTRTRGLRPIYVGGIPPIFVRPEESDLEVVRQIFVARSYEIYPTEIDDRVKSRYKAILDTGKRPIIVDAGANIGVASIWFAREYPEARIIGVEPDPGNLALLEENVRPYENCVVMGAGVGAERGFATLTNSHEELAYTIQTTRSASGVPIVTMQDAFTASGGDVPFIVKIDIEGFERDLFASNLDWLKDIFAVFIEPHDWMFPGQRTSGPLQQAMAKLPFELFVLDENLLYVKIE